MFREIRKDITTIEDGVLLHGCNCSGGFGSGVAGAIRKKWPAAYTTFMENGKGAHLLGSTQFILESEHIPIIIGNAYTQINYGNDGKRYADLDAIESCTRKGLAFAEAYNKDLYMPKIGCGLGGLSWEDEVKPIFLKVSQTKPEINMFICDL